MKYYSELDAEQVSNYTCWLFDWFVENGLTPSEPSEFAEFVVQNLAEEAVPVGARIQLHQAIEQYREGILEAQTSPGVDAETALETYCLLS